MSRSTGPTIDELEAMLNDPNPPAMEITPAGEVVMKGLRCEIQQAINRVSAENGSNTPDFILADYLASCLAAFDRAVTQRERWYGYRMRVGMADTIHRELESDALSDSQANKHE